MIMIKNYRIQYNVLRCIDSRIKFSPYLFEYFMKFPKFYQNSVRDLCFLLLSKVFKKKHYKKYLQGHGTFVDHHP